MPSVRLYLVETALSLEFDSHTLPPIVFRLCLIDRYRNLRFVGAVRGVRDKNVTKAVG